MTKVDLQLLRFLVKRELKRIEIDHGMALTKVSSKGDRTVNVMGEILQLLPNKIYELPSYVLEIAAEEGALESAEEELDIKTVNRLQWLESSYEAGLSKLPASFYPKSRRLLRRLKNKDSRAFTEAESTLLALLDSRLNKIVKLALSRKSGAHQREKMQPEEIALYDFVKTIVDTWRGDVIGIGS
jgi:hypothetical protein